MERCPKLIIQEAYGELSRAFKKLKNLETDPVKRSAYGDLAGAYRKLRAKSRAEDKPLPAPFKLKWSSATEYMASGKVLWGCNFYDKFLTACVKDAVRGDRFKNRWVADANGRRGWRTATEREFRTIFNEVYDFHADCLALLEQHDTLEKWLENVGYVTERQWGRRFLFNTVPLKLKTFLCHCIAEHFRQRPLRG